MAATTTMKFETTVLSPNGEKAPFGLALERVPHGIAGTMVWGDSAYAIKDVRAEGSDSFYCSTLWMGVYTRTWIVAYAEDDRHVLSIRIFGNPFDYSMSRDGFANFLTFIAGLREGERSNAELVPAGTLESVLDDAQVKQRSVCLYQGANLYKNLPVRFAACAVNGVSVNIDFPSPLPQQMGTYIALGYFEPGHTIEIEWALQTWDVPVGAAIAVGAFRDGSLQDRTHLQTLPTQPYQSYKGSATLVI